MTPRRLQVKSRFAVKFSRRMKEREKCRKNKALAMWGLHLREAFL